MQIGQIVKLRAYGGEIIERRVVAIEADVVAVCTDKEYVEAKQEGREPLAVGFKREDVMADSD